MEAKQERIILSVTVRSKRESLGWLQKDLAKRANVAPITVWRAENGKAIRRLYATRIALALGETVENLGIKLVETPSEEP